jgi:hypothetical protein
LAAKLTGCKIDIKSESQMGLATNNPDLGVTHEVEE